MWIDIEVYKRKRGQAHITETMYRNVTETWKIFCQIAMKTESEWYSPNWRDYPAVVTRHWRKVTERNSQTAVCFMKRNVF